MSQYRDGFAGVREQIAERRSHVEEALRKLTPLHRAVFDMSAIDRALARASDDTLPPAEVFALLERLLVAIPFAYDEAQAHLEVRGDAPASMLGAPSMGPDAFPALEIAVAKHGAEAVRDDGGARALILVGGVTISVAVRASSIGDLIDFDGCTDWLLGSAAIAVPPALPRMRVSRGAFGDGILARLGLIEDHAIGDVVFDGAFRIRGAPAVARTLLVDDVRRALLKLDERAPVLDVHEGRAQLSWAERWEDDPDCVLRAEAIEVLLGISKALAVSTRNDVP